MEKLNMIKPYENEMFYFTELKELITAKQAIFQKP